MILTDLSITNLRNISNSSIAPHPKFNYFYGENGSGKTSVLEAIAFYGLGRSFRTNQYSRVIKNNEESLTLFARFSLLTSNNRVIGLEKNRSGDINIRIDGEKVTGLANLVDLFPMVIINPDSYRMLEDGPKFRRDFLNFIMFHVKHSFNKLWQTLQHILKQRNAALKYDNRFSHLEYWNIEFVKVSEALDQSYKQVFEQLKQVFNDIYPKSLDPERFSFEYHRGWDANASLLSVLEKQFQRDQILGYTQSGPQRLDFQIKYDGIPVELLFSRGQLKLLVSCLKLSQGVLIKQQTTKSVTYLLDDLPSEYDSVHKDHLLRVLSDLDSQVFISGIEKEALLPLINHQNSQMFHVKHGEIHQQLP